MTVRFEPPARENPPEGPVTLAVATVSDLGMQLNPWGKNNHVIDVGFLTQYASPITGQPIPISQRFNMVMGEKAKILSFYRACVNSKSAFIPKGFEFEQLIGVNLRGSIVYNVKPDGTVWANLARDFFPADPTAPRVIIPSIAYPQAGPQNPPDLQAKIDASKRSAATIFAPQPTAEPVAETSRPATRTPVRDKDRTAFVTGAVGVDPLEGEQAAG